MPDMLAAAKAEGALTNLVTNGSRIDPTWIGTHADVLDLLTVSIDSAADATHRAMGRATPGGQTIPAHHQIALADAARAAGVRYKLNTVVTTLNQGEDMSTLVLRLGPERWKLLQAAPVEGQNEAHIALLTPTREAFDAYVNRHRAALATLGATGIRVVPEPIEAIRGSYVMVDPQGRFSDSTTGRHRYSRPILEVGHDAAFAEVDFDHDKFDARGGRADYAPDQTASAA
jgi:radical S-adenosyl methionine domain-containing protein 2